MQIDEAEVTARFAVSALKISALCAAALSEKGLLPPQKAQSCAEELLQVAAVQEAYRQQKDGDALPSEFASLLQSLARIIQDRAGG